MVEHHGFPRGKHLSGNGLSDRHLDRRGQFPIDPNGPADTQALLLVAFREHDRNAVALGHVGHGGDGAVQDFVQAPTTSDGPTEFDQTSQNADVLSAHLVAAEQVSLALILAGHRPDPEGQFRGPNRFGQVFVGPGFETGQDILVLGQGADHDDGNVAGVGIGFQPACTFETVQVRHHHVHDDDVRGVLIDAGEGFVAVNRLAHLVTRMLQETPAERLIGRLVVHHEHGRPVVACWAGRTRRHGRTPGCGRRSN